jgi:predicted tellurium resistance membrane protein TerC
LILDTGDDTEHDIKVTSFWGAMKTIIVADALMGIDNVLGVAGAAQGAFDLVVIGLIISVPIVVFGSTLVLKLVERFPIIITLGAAVLAFTAAKMITDEKLLDPVFGGTERINEIARWATYVIAIAIVLITGRIASRKSSTKNN